MTGDLVFFAVHADDLDRARNFYGNVFGWRFEPWGPPGFFLVGTGSTDAPGCQGALQKRHALVDGKSPFTYECTLEVADIDAAAAAIEANGGKVLSPKFHIPTVGHIMKFQDSEGNVVCAKQPE